MLFRTSIRPILRLVLRGSALAAHLAWAWVCYFPAVLWKPEDEREAARAEWVHLTARRLLSVFNLEVSVTGLVPRTGLLVSNHLSYLDIIFLAALTPATFVSKHEVASWPVFGWFARAAGTVFVRRQRRGDAGRVNEQLRALLGRDRLVVLFPEGTSSDGQTVLPFRSSLLQAALVTESPTHVACLAYSLTDGDAREEVCYWKDMIFFPHLLKLLGKAAISASVRFQPAPRAAERKTFAKELHHQLVELHRSIGNRAA